MAAKEQVQLFKNNLTAIKYFNGTGFAPIKVRKLISRIDKELGDNRTNAALKLLDRAIRLAKVDKNSKPYFKSWLDLFRACGFLIVPNRNDCLSVDQRYCLSCGLMAAGASQWSYTFMHPDIPARWTICAGHYGVDIAHLLDYQVRRLHFNYAGGERLVETGRKIANILLLRNDNIWVRKAKPLMLTNEMKERVNRLIEFEKELALEHIKAAALAESKKKNNRTTKKKEGTINPYTYPHYERM